MLENAQIVVIIPALNEQEAMAEVLRDVPSWVDRVIVADNGSTDATAQIAAEQGAIVVTEPRRGYGAAVLAGLAVLDKTEPPEVVVFLDADRSDNATEMRRLVEPILHGEAELVIGSRVLGRAERGALTIQQRFGNALACWLMRMRFGVRYTDLGPFRAMRYSALRRLRMSERGYGWTVQMQVRVALHGMRGVEVPVSYRRRIGVSKISGTVRGVIGAGTKILSTIFRESSPAPATQPPLRERLILFSRYPQPGKVKTRLIPLLGERGAADLYRQLLVMTVGAARRLMGIRPVSVQMRATGGPLDRMRSFCDARFGLCDQGGGDLGERLRRASEEAFQQGMKRVVMIGSDCPDLGGQRLDEAFRALEHHDLVVGPAADGGYYLVGTTQHRPSLFDAIPWSGAQVLQRTLEEAGRLQLSLATLPLLHDVDTPADLATWKRGKGPDPAKGPLLSVIIPARNEQDQLAATIASVLGEPGVEVLVVDGLSDDRTVEVARGFDVRVVSAPSSRGQQLNAGVAASSGEILLFLHADTLLPPHYLRSVVSALQGPDIVAGAFRLHVDAEGASFRIVEMGANLRSTFCRLPYGDQAMFMTRRTFESVGGFPEQCQMEDYVLVRRLRKLGRIRILPDAVRTSARRWQRHGVWRTTLLNQVVIAAYHLGISPSRIAGWRR